MKCESHSVLVNSILQMVEESRGLSIIIIDPYATFTHSLMINLVLSYLSQPPSSKMSFHGIVSQNNSMSDIINENTTPKLYFIYFFLFPEWLGSNFTSIDNFCLRIFESE